MMNYCFSTSYNHLSDFCCYLHVMIYIKVVFKVILHDDY